MLLLIILNIFQFSLIRHGSRLDRRDFTMNPTEETGTSERRALYAFAELYE
jgi:hypothetical protein